MSYPFWILINLYAFIMIRKIIGFVITVIAASYIMYLGIESRNTNYNTYLALVFISIFLYTLAGINLIKTIRRNRKTK